MEEDAKLLKFLKDKPVSEKDLNIIQRWLKKINSPQLENRQCPNCGFIASHSTNLYRHITEKHPSFSNKRKSVKRKSVKRK